MSTEQEVYRGQEALLKLDQLVVEGDVLFVAGQETYPACGISAEIESFGKKRKLIRFSDFSPNPELAELIALRDLVISHGLPNFSAILAVGGGTAIDLAKLVKAFALGQQTTPESIAEPPERIWEIPSIAIPTTAGSGSEATQFAVIYAGGTKFSVEHQALRPEVCLLVPHVLESLPKNVAAASGLDALCQGIESFWSVHSTSTSRELAARAIELAWGSLEEFVHRRTESACANMSEASHLAGRAIAMTKTTAPHAVSYPITSNFGVAHGHAVALMLAAIFPFNAGVDDTDSLDQRGVSFVRESLSDLYRTLGVDDASAAKAAILTMVSRLGLEASFPKLGINTETEVETIVANGFNPGRVNNNPRRLTREALTSILHQEIDAIP